MSTFPCTGRACRDGGWSGAGGGRSAAGAGSTAHEATGSEWAVGRGLLGLAWGWVSARARKMPASTSIVWPIAPPRQLPFVPSQNRFYKTRLISLDNCCRIPNSWMLQRCVMVYRRVEKTRGGSEQLLSVGVLQAVRGFFPLD